MEGPWDVVIIEAFPCTHLCITRAPLLQPPEAHSIGHRRGQHAPSHFLHASGRCGEPHWGPRLKATLQAPQSCSPTTQPQQLMTLPGHSQPKDPIRVHRRCLNHSAKMHTSEEIHTTMLMNFHEDSFKEREIAN